MARIFSIFVRIFSKSKIMKDKESRIPVLELNWKEARSFFIKGSSYCTLHLPEYFTFDDLLNEISQSMEERELKEIYVKRPRNFDDINHVILSNKDGKLSWRPMEFTHPVLYVCLVHKITEEKNWEFIRKQFKEFSDLSSIECLSIPVRSQTSKSDKAQQVSQWWMGMEQRSIELSLKYKYISRTDITGCYGSIYTHSIAWALHGREEAKKNRNCKSLIGNIIDNYIQEMRNGQTNGIPQNSVLMDFIAEMVLGYADVKIHFKIKKELENLDYKILRYRDDYRIFTHNHSEGEKILKIITEIISQLSMQINSSKTSISSQVVRDSIKPDKTEWLKRKQSMKSMQKTLMLIHDMSLAYPNTGSMISALNKFHKILLDKRPKNVLPLIAITIDIALRSPRLYPQIVAIIGELIKNMTDKEWSDVLQDIIKRFEDVPNTGHLQIWLQRITQHRDPDKGLSFYREPKERLCELLTGNKISIWNNDWLKKGSIKDMIESVSIIDTDKLKKAGSTIPSKELNLFSVEYY